MKKVDIIRPGSINDIIGPIGTLKRILRNRGYFMERGFDVTLFTNDSLIDGPFHEPPSISIIHKTGIVAKFRKRLGYIIRILARSNSRLSVLLIKREMRIINKLVKYYISLDRNPDIIEFHSNLECFIYLKHTNSNSCKSVMFLHTDGIPFKMTLQYYPLLKNSRYYKKMVDDFQWTIDHTDRIVFIANVAKTNFIGLYPKYPFRKLSVIVNGIDDFTKQQKTEFDFIRNNSTRSPFKYRLCCSGTINNRKGHRIIIESLHLLSSQILSRIHVDFMGDGAERPILEKLVKKYGLERNVKFYGLVPNDDIFKYLANNNLYILMSKNEGLPISIIEAMRAGLPVITTNVSGIPELVKDGINGFLLKPDVHELSNMFNNLDNYEWDHMGQKSRELYERDFTFDRMEKEFCDMYNDILK